MGLHTLVGTEKMISFDFLITLKAKEEHVRLVSPIPCMLKGVEHKLININNYEHLVDAVAGSTVVYMLVLFPVEKEEFVRDCLNMMRNVINASKEARAKFIYLDQAYVNREISGIISEDNMYDPTGLSGKTHAKMAEMLQNEMREGTIKAAIARTTDFFGPGCPTYSKINRFIFDNLQQKRRAIWSVDVHTIRTFNYFPDIARALYVLGTNKSAIGQLWHMPAASPGISVSELIQLASLYMNASEKPLIIPTWLLQAMQPFNHWFKSLYETSCKNDNSFIFNSSKFENTFNFLPTPYGISIKATAEWYQNLPEIYR
jgi:nucleoside-diphosphate-sugar epimerase